MTRIIAGALGGRRLVTPQGAGTRPTSDRVREALFSRAESLLGSFDGVSALDLYAGSGAVGLEAVSRGAADAVLVESDRRVAALARDNASRLAVADRVRVLAERVQDALRRAPQQRAALLVFVDPPYQVDSATVRDVLTLGARTGWFDPDALLVVERPTRTEWSFPPGVRSEGQRRYGETTLWYGRRDPAAPGP